MARNTHYIVIFTFGIWASLSIAPPVHRRHLNLYFLYHNKFALCGSVGINFKLVYFWNYYHNLVSIFGKCDKISKKEQKSAQS